MDEAHHDLYQKIINYSLDDPTARFPLLHRVALENRWSHPYAQRVGYEYLRFAFLCVISDFPLTPSDEIDQVWHMHILYTRDYEEFCEHYLGKKLHHGPTKGGKEEQEKYDYWYKRTLQFYESVFHHPPPEDIWLPAEIRFQKAHWIRLNALNHIIIKIPRWLQKLLS